MDWICYVSFLGRWKEDIKSLAKRNIYIKYLWLNPLLKEEFQAEGYEIFFANGPLANEVWLGETSPQAEESSVLGFLDTLAPMSQAELAYEELQIKSLPWRPRTVCPCPFCNGTGRINFEDLPYWSGWAKGKEPPYWNELRSAVITRDGHKCRLCGERENLSIHHIIHKEKTGPDSLRNLLTLCASCHTQMHLDT